MKTGGASKTKSPRQITPPANTKGAETTPSAI